MDVERVVFDGFEGVHLVADLRGDPDAWPVLFLHGGGQTRYAWGRTAEIVAAHGWRTVALDLRGHGDSDAGFESYGDGETAEAILALIEEVGGPAVIVGNSMGAGAAAVAAAEQPESITGLVLVGPFVRNGKVNAIQRAILRVAMAPMWAASAWKSYMPKLYAGQRPEDCDEYRDRLVACLRRPGYAKAFSLTTRTDHAPAETRLADVSAPTLVVMGEEDPDFPDPRAEADWIAEALRAEVVMVPQAGHYPQSQQPEITAEAVVGFLNVVNGRG